MRIQGMITAIAFPRENAAPNAPEQTKVKRMVSSTLAQEISVMEADPCSAFSDPTRILMLYALNEQSRTSASPTASV